MLQDLSVCVQPEEEAGAGESYRNEEEGDSGESSGSSGILESPMEMVAE